MTGDQTTPFDFKAEFKSLTTYPPLHWQIRLYDEFRKGSESLPGVIDLPTGLGKTMVMAIWLIARSQPGSKLPRRLIYVVDRRTVVDQATDLAMKLREKHGKDNLVISTLRGQLADNREWSKDPGKPAIIIGTVDLIGSGLLFSGYRSSYKRRPLESGLLGQDSLLVLDEAHLSKPFEKLICNIGDAGTFQKNRDGKPCGTPMKVIRMSATTGDSDANRFKLEDSDYSDPVIKERFEAEKTLTIEQKEAVDAKLFADRAIELANDCSLNGKRIVVFVRSPDSATKIADAIRKQGDNKNKAYAGTVAVLTGTMRGLERDEVVEKPVMKRFLAADDPESGPCFLISTSAGEVGFDLNADHMVGDLSPLDSWIQRLGRVNRRGGKMRSAKIVMLAEFPKQKKAKDGKLLPLEPFQMALKTTADLLRNVSDVSPKALAEFKSKLSPDQLKAASTPEPAMVELTDILLDAWSMTSITAPMPGRPEVAPWLRGIDDELPQTTVAWRVELDLLKDSFKPEKAFQAIFAKHRIRPHESLTANSCNFAEFLNSITRKRPDLRDTRVVVKLSHALLIKTIGELIDNGGILNADPMLILPASFGGLKNGMLSHEAVAPVPTPDDPPPPSLDVADKHGYEPHVDDRARLRILIDRTNDGWKTIPLPGGEPIPTDLNFDDHHDTSTLLFKAFTKAGLRVRLVQSVKFDDDGESIRSLVLLSSVGDKSKKQDQSLTEHVGAVETEAHGIAEKLSLKEPILPALVFAARWHDEGKKADIWQRFVNGPGANGQPLGKAAFTRDPKSLSGYRHEFGSLLRILHPDHHNTNCTLPADPDTRDIALHLITTHHGFGRPHFINLLVNGFSTTECQAIHTEAIRRFASLQRKYGHWHLAWLENLLRCADALASADQDAEDDTAESSEAAGGVK